MSEMHRPPWFDPRMPARERCVLSALLKRGAVDCPQHVLARFEDGTRWTYADALSQARDRAAGLHALGVRRGDPVLVWCPNGPEAVRSWFAIALLGACFVPINPAFLGQLLANVIANANARLMIAHRDLIGRLAEIDCAGLTTVFSIGGRPQVAPAQIAVRDVAELDGKGDSMQFPDDLMPWDLESIIFTSGTTGVSKGASSSYFHLYTVAEVLHGHMSPSDRILVNAPLFHIGGTGAITAALIHQGSFALVDGFKAATFWKVVRETGSTMTSGLIGSMAPYLAKFGSTADRSDSLLRRTHFYPVTEETIGFAREFGFEYFSGYGMTELPLILVTDLDTTVLNSCGRARSGVECRLVDGNDLEVPIGTAGELVARTEHTWSFASEYNGQPEATARAWRNGWFHTGDLLRQDQEGNYYFVDRLKDAIRRRGENISSQEVEQAVRLHPDVTDVAAIGVPSEFGEDEVLIAVTCRPGATLTPRQLRAFLEPHLPRFMLPRYLRFLESLPKTPTDKVRKQQLRDEGVTAATWDHQKSGSEAKPS